MAMEPMEPSLSPEEGLGSPDMPTLGGGIGAGMKTAPRAPKELTGVHPANGSPEPSRLNGDHTRHPMTGAFTRGYRK